VGPRFREAIEEGTTEVSVHLKNNHDSLYDYIDIEKEEARVDSSSMHARWTSGCEGKGIRRYTGDSWLSL
jgi:hypothetical protein